ncbi:hybrid sensor histidine kinase/response regulator [Azohydromonas australica]|uniref:hybrid sensor histidine kinase/response regulator n=1 Tax=Azohydromonas australica TaxID=364039 RepID=UPI000410ED78|nr:ATP-binding protein [Azohydromonas australica]
MKQPPAILIVEDEAVIALDLKLELQDMGYRVLGPATSGEQALRLAAQEPPDLVLMDIRIHGPLDGVDTAARLGSGGGPPVIFLTSHSDDDTVARAARTAPLGFITKPFQPRELRAAIEVALARTALERAQRAAETAQAQRDAQVLLLSRASHEMRTPLNAVLGFAQLLRTLPGNDSPLAQRYLGHIDEAGHQLLALVEDLLDLQQGEDGLRQLLQPESLALADCVQAALEPLAALAQARRVSVHGHDVAPALRVRADAARLQKALAALACNAIRYGHEGGHLWVQAQALEGRVRLTLADDGEGIAPERLAQLFQPFARAGREHSAIQGAGLGLATARTLVQAMDGTLELHSSPGQGTVVSLELPAG